MPNKIFVIGTCIIIVVVAASVVNAVLHQKNTHVAEPDIQRNQTAIATKLPSTALSATSTVTSAPNDSTETVLPEKTAVSFTKDSWNSFVKPSEEVLRSRLSPLQYLVTQEEGTEYPYKNQYEHNTAEGIYADIVSGEPLFFSKDKYDSGTGWPSFVKPISPEVVIFKSDSLLSAERTEVRSAHADSHLGHVFDDGPVDRGGKRYCMNSASLLFIAKVDMEKEGYGYLLAQMQ